MRPKNCQRKQSLLFVLKKRGLYIYTPRIKLDIITVKEGEQDVYKDIAGTSASGCP